MLRKCLALSVVSLILAGCHIPSPADQNWVLRSYPVPPDDAVGLLAHLKDLFILSHGGDKGESGYTQLARASIAPDGRLVVLGSPEIQAGVQDLVASMASHPPPPAHMVETTYWLVTGKPAKGETTIPVDLSAVAPALRELAKQSGAQDFALWEELRMLSGSLESEVTGRHAQAKQTALALSGSSDVLLTVDINASRLSEHMKGPNQIKTKVRVAPDQTVVLAQTGFNPAEDLGSPSGNEPPMALYYLVRATVRNGDPAHR